MLFMRKILLITGWGVGIQPLLPLQQELIDQGFKVELIDIFDVFNPIEMAKQLDFAQNFDVIIGWSLGGQIATLLVDQLYKQKGQLKTLITLASNPKFVANQEWSIGMESNTFSSFQSAFKKDPSTTLKRFCYLVTQGGIDAKSDWRKLQSYVNEAHLELKNKGLDMLGAINNVTILKSIVGNQYHIFAEQDSLVGYKVVGNIQKMSAIFIKLEVVNGSHGFPVFEPKLISGKISQYLNAIQET